MKPLISVVVPARNEEKYLGSCLEALLRQDFQSYEVIVVDNASTDNTSSIAKQYKVRLVFERKTGLSYARNKGFSKALGEIIARTDADAIPPKNWLSRIYEVFEEDPKVVAVTGSDEFFDQGILLKYISRFLFLMNFYLIRMFFGHYQLSGPNFAVRKYTLNGIRFHENDSKVHEDQDIACHLCSQGKIVFVPSLVMPISGRRLKSDPLYLIRYFKKTIYTFFLHHPVHKWHSV